MKNLNITNRFTLVILLCMGVGFSTAKVFAQSGKTSQTNSWQNPVLNRDFPDPTVIRTPDGMFYAYATNTHFKGKYVHIQLASSADGVHWNWLGDALPNKPEWARQSNKFWAPDVVYDKVKKRYLLYYAAESDADTLGMGIGIAVSDYPRGPFVSIDTPLICGKKFEVLDPMAFEDPVSGKHYLYWGSDFKPIRVQQLSDDWLHFASGSKAKIALEPDKDKDYDKLIEGPWITYHAGYYYMFYSGDNCCGIHAHYAVMAARSKNPEGPFIRYSEAHQTGSSVILEANDQWIAPGHNSVVKDGLGNLWMYYHAIPKTHFQQKKYGRVMLRDRIRFVNGWPEVAEGSPTYTPQKETTFTNPILPSGADPWALFHEGYYYYMQTMGNRLVIWKTNDLATLENAQKKTIWKAVPHTSYSHDIWAPELHFIAGNWYVYFAADNGKNENHRIYVLENKAADPTTGNWTFKGEITDSSDKWAIDASVFEYKNQWYMIWSGWEGDTNGQQNIYIARMKNPWTIEGQRVMISYPEYAWEKHGDLPGQIPPHVNVNEGPEILKHGEDLFLVYSASGCWTDFYALGMLKLINPANLLSAASWKKYPKPVFKESKESGVFAPGHNSFFKSPDGSQDWILYHANSFSGAGCGGHRSPRMQPFTWNTDGTPDFGVPVKTGKPLALPSGTLAK